jgi:GT2 family glycosyltransferase
MKCEIIIIVWNQLKVTKNCLESVISKTKAPFRILLIDNASDRETACFLKDFTSEYNTQVKLIRNELNLGFVKAANQGLEISRADLVCLLNNDTLVTEGWLSELIFVALNNSKIGLLNPSSNTLGQKTNLKNIDAFARSFRRYHGQFEEMAQASGFCMVIKKEIIQKIGKFDEIYGMGSFEDTDYSRRAVKAGFICARALASYVYHREGTSFLKMRSYDKSFRENQALFYNRWGKPKRIFIEAKKGLLPKHINKLLSLARCGHWIFIAKEKNVSLPILRHSNVKVLAFKRSIFGISCFFRILKRLKKKYNYLIIQSLFLKKALMSLKFLHRAQILNLRELETIEKNA